MSQSEDTWSERAADEFLRVALDRAPLYLLAGSGVLAVVVAVRLVVQAVTGA